MERQMFSYYRKLALTGRIYKKLESNNTSIAMLSKFDYDKMSNTIFSKHNDIYLNYNQTLTHFPIFSP